MHHALIKSLSLLDASGYVIIAAILVLLGAGVAVTVLVRARYARIERDLVAGARPSPAFETAVLNTIVRDTQAALRRHSGEVNTQAIIDHGFQSELRALLVGERFVRAATGLMIILGLVGTFYGLTLSIGKLVALVSSDPTGATEITESLTRGLSEALAGMSVAFSTSLFGILSAIVMTLLGVFVNVQDRRTALSVQIEAFLDNVFIAAQRSEGVALGAPSAANARGATSDERLEQVVSTFGQSVGRLESAVSSFEVALTSFATTTRDFREFNAHLKDNIQRMSLGFADLSATLEEQSRAWKSRERS